MKKIIAVALSLMLLCGAATVFADTSMTTPSKTQEDMTTFEVSVEFPVDGKSVGIFAINEDTVDDITKYQANLDAAAAELAKAQNAKTMEGYFGADIATAIAAIVGNDAEISMDELVAIFQSGYEAGMGNATVGVGVPTPYANGEKAAALIGIIKGGVMNWNVYEAVGQPDGRLQFTVDGNTMLEINPNITLFAVCK